jgi:hypothetical protein
MYVAEADIPTADSDRRDVSKETDNNPNEIPCPDPMMYSNNDKTTQLHQISREAFPS